MLAVCRHFVHFVITTLLCGPGWYMPHAPAVLTAALAHRSPLLPIPARQAVLQTPAQSADTICFVSADLRINNPLRRRRSRNLAVMPLRRNASRPVSAARLSISLLSRGFECEVSRTLLYPLVCQDLMRTGGLSSVPGIFFDLFCALKIRSAQARV